MRNFEMGGTSFTADSNDPMIGGTMASSMATGGGTKSAFDSTKARLKGKSQEYRINKLIEAVKKANWSSNPLTVNSGIVKVYSNMYDLEPTRVASIFNNYQKGNKMKKGGGIKTKKDYIEYLNEVGVPEHDHPENEGRVSWAFVNRYGEWLKKNDPIAFEVGYSEWKNGYAKGGGLKGKAKYVPNYMVQSVEVERKGKTTDIDGANILDGVYVKKGVKFAKGGGFDGVDTELIDASAKTIYDKDGIMGLRNKFLVLANTDEKHGDKSTANYRRKVVADYQAKQPKFMAKGGKMEWGGTAESSETGAFIGGENASSMYKRGGGLETAKISELKKDMIVYPIYGSYAGKKGYVNKIMPDNKTVEVIFKNKVGNEYVKFEGNELTTNLKYLNGGAMNETFPENDAMSYNKGGVIKYNYFYYKQPITKDEFLKNVPKNWKQEIEFGEYSYGGYRATEVENEEYANGGSTSTWSYSIGGL